MNTCGKCCVAIFVILLTRSNVTPLKTYASCASLSSRPEFVYTCEPVAVGSALRSVTLNSAGLQSAAWRVMDTSVCPQWVPRLGWVGFG